MFGEKYYYVKFERDDKSELVIEEKEKKIPEPTYDFLMKNSEQKYNRSLDDRIRLSPLQGPPNFLHNHCFLHKNGRIAGVSLVGDGRWGTSRKNFYQEDRMFGGDFPELNAFTDEQNEAALLLTHAVLDKEIKALPDSHTKAGSTFRGMVIPNDPKKKTIIANIADSQSFYKEHKSALTSFNNHLHNLKPVLNEAERQRVNLTLNGSFIGTHPKQTYVTKSGQSLSVNVSRAYGDKGDFGNGLIPDPSLEYHSPSKEKPFLYVLSSDGLTEAWETQSQENEEIDGVLNVYEDKSLLEKCIRLAWKGLLAGSTDNITVLLVSIDPEHPLEHTIVVFIVDGHKGDFIASFIHTHWRDIHLRSAELIKKIPLVIIKQLITQRNEFLTCTLEISPSEDSKGLKQWVTIEANRFVSECLLAFQALFPKNTSSTESKEAKDLKDDAFQTIIKQKLAQTTQNINGILQYGNKVSPSVETKDTKETKPDKPQTSPVSELLLNTTQDFYSILGVKKDCSALELKKAFEEKSQLDDPHLVDICVAYSVLTHTGLRKKYDEKTATSNSLAASGKSAPENPDLSIIQAKLSVLLHYLKEWDVPLQFYCQLYANKEVMALIAPILINGREASDSSLSEIHEVSWLQIAHHNAHIVKVLQDNPSLFNKWYLAEILISTNLGCFVAALKRDLSAKKLMFALSLLTQKYGKKLLEELKPYYGTRVEAYLEMRNTTWTASLSDLQKFYPLYVKVKFLDGCDLDGILVENPTAYLPLIRWKIDTRKTVGKSVKDSKDVKDTKNSVIPVSQMQFHVNTSQGPLVQGAYILKRGVLASGFELAKGLLCDDPEVSRSLYKNFYLNLCAQHPKLWELFLAHPVSLEIPQDQITQNIPNDKRYLLVDEKIIQLRQQRALALFRSNMEAALREPTPEALTTILAETGLKFTSDTLVVCQPFLQTILAIFKNSNLRDQISHEKWIALAKHKLLLWENEATSDSFFTGTELHEIIKADSSTSDDIRTILKNPARREAFLGRVLSAYPIQHPAVESIRLAEFFATDQKSIAFRDAMRVYLSESQEKFAATEIKNVTDRKKLQDAIQALQICQAYQTLLPQGFQPSTRWADTHSEKILASILQGFKYQPTLATKSDSKRSESKDSDVKSNAEPAFKTKDEALVHYLRNNPLFRALCVMGENCRDLSCDSKLLSTYYKDWLVFAGECTTTLWELYFKSTILAQPWREISFYDVNGVFRFYMRYKKSTHNFESHLMSPLQYAYTLLVAGEDSEAKSIDSILETGQTHPIYLLLQRGASNVYNFSYFLIDYLKDIVPSIQNELKRLEQEENGDSTQKNTQAIKLRRQNIKLRMDSILEITLEFFKRVQKDIIDREFPFNPSLSVLWENLLFTLDHIVSKAENLKDIQDRLETKSGSSDSYDYHGKTPFIPSTSSKSSPGILLVTALFKALSDYPFTLLNSINTYKLALVNPPDMRAFLEEKGLDEFTSGNKKIKRLKARGGDLKLYLHTQPQADFSKQFEHCLNAQPFNPKSLIALLNKFANKSETPQEFKTILKATLNSIDPKNTNQLEDRMREILKPYEVSQKLTASATASESKDEKQGTGKLSSLFGVFKRGGQQAQPIQPLKPNQVSIQAGQTSGSDKTSGFERKS